ncbi:MAG: hypothetical protein ACJ73E_15625 [Mycobacteriales bacterium]
MAQGAGQGLDPRVAEPQGWGPPPVLAALWKANPEIGRTVAIDGSDLPAYANWPRYLSKGGKLLAA